MKCGYKLVGILIVFILTVVVLVGVTYDTQPVQQSNTKIRVCVVDLDGQPIHNAKVNVLSGSLKFNTDNNGLSPVIDLPTLSNVYDSKISQWYTVNLQISKVGYVDTFVLNCVVYVSQTRSLTVRVYPSDASNLPYVCYVESPPNDYFKSLITQK